MGRPLLPDQLSAAGGVEEGLVWQSERRGRHRKPLAVPYYRSPAAAAGDPDQLHRVRGRQRGGGAALPSATLSVLAVSDVQQPIYRTAI
jgi:hypothetical protein